MLYCRYHHIPYSSSNDSSLTVVQQDVGFNGENGNFLDLNNIQIPIVGYEVMEERARFTVRIQGHS